MSRLRVEGAGAASAATGSTVAKACGPATPHSSIVEITQSDRLLCFDPSGSTVGKSSILTFVKPDLVPQLSRAQRQVPTDTSIGAMMAALNSGQLGLIRWDEFLGRQMITRNENQVPLDREIITQLIGEFEKLGFRRVNRSVFEEAVYAVAKSNRFDGAQEWLDQLPAWDGVQRIERFLPDYLGTRSGRYEFAVGRYLWTAMVGRILVPGCKADMVPVLIGMQGFLKSSVLTAIAPTPDHCGEACLTSHSTELVRKVVGKTLVVWEEMRGITGKSDADDVKTFITIPYLEMRSSDHAGMDRHPRRFIIVGTSNQKDILRDVTGNRRYLPFEVPSRIAVDKVIADRLQLWAEAVQVVRDRIASGDSAVDFQEAERLAGNEHRGFIKEGRWDGSKQLLNWLAGADDGFSTEDALNAIGMSSAQITHRDKREMAYTLRQLRYELRPKRLPKASIGDGPSHAKRWQKCRAAAVT